MPVRPATAEDWQWINANADAVGGPQVVSNGVLHRLQDYPACVAHTKNELTGFAVYIPDQPSCELLAIAAISPGNGVGTTLMNWVEQAAAKLGCTHIWLATTNDNLDAIKFYQRNSYTLLKLRPGAFKGVLRLKGLDPDSTVIGNFGIPIRDEIQMEKELSHASPREVNR